MGRWVDLAAQDSTPNHGGAMLEVRGLILHIAEGYYFGTRDYQKNPASQVSSHLIISDGVKGQGRDGDATQMVDTDVTAWTQQNGNGRWLSAEFAGFTPHGLTAAQVEKAAQAFARGHQVYGYPLQLATSPNGRGLGHHSMGTNGRSVPTDTWTGATWGHEDCPGPAIVAQKPAILARAIQIINGGDMAGVVVDMIATKLSNGMSANDVLTRILGRLPTDLANLDAEFAAVLTAAHNDSETDASISDAAVQKITAALLAVLPGGGTGLTAAQVCDEMDARARARINAPI